jgi:two-component system sensor histidine kinase HydH
MHRRILIPITVPVVVIGGLLCGTCLVSVWYIHRLQTNQARVLLENVASLKAAQDLEIVLRQLRFHSFVYLADPRPDRLNPIEMDHLKFEKALRVVEESNRTPDQRATVDAIRAGYLKYRGKMSKLRDEVASGKPLTNFGQLADSHPIQSAVEPCQDLLQLNQAAMDASSEDNDRTSRQARLVMLLMGIIGPLSGIGFGVGIARTLSRSILQLSVRVQNIAQKLDQDVASVAIVADGDIDNLDRQLQHVLQRVEEVTERTQQHHREMLRAEQLAAVGQMAASVAHEVRNPLTAVKMLVELAIRSRDPKPLSADDLRVIHNEVTRLERTIQGFLDLARLPTPKRIECDLRDPVAQAVELFRVRAEQQNVTIVNLCPPEPVPAFVDCEQLRTVLVNLGLNALDAMPHGGRLEVNLTPTPEELHIQVTDTGSGIGPEILNRLFTPFASTKPTGTGLGLSISRRIVQEHGGDLTATNCPECGACFTINLPNERPLKNTRARLPDRTRNALCQNS